jgi:dihydrofolate reductase
MKLIVAVNNKNVIGVDNKIPWLHKEDLRHFAKTTKNAIVIMGRKTFESVGPLAGRYNTVLTSNPEEHSEDVFYARNVSEASIVAEDYWKKYPEKTVFVIGGSFVYESFLYERLIDEIILTQINDNSEGDTFFELPDGWVVKKFKDLDKTATVYHYVKKNGEK